jgi:hypothetical protein
MERPATYGGFPSSDLFSSHNTPRSRETSPNGGSRDRPRSRELSIDELDDVSILQRLTRPATSPSVISERKPPVVLPGAIEWARGQARQLTDPKQRDFALPLVHAQYRALRNLRGSDKDLYCATGHLATAIIKARVTKLSEARAKRREEMKAEFHKQQRREAYARSKAGRAARAQRVKERMEKSLAEGPKVQTAFSSNKLGEQRAGKRTAGIEEMLHPEQLDNQLYKQKTLEKAEATLLGARLERKDNQRKDELALEKEKKKKPKKPPVNYAKDLLAVQVEPKRHLSALDMMLDHSRGSKSPRPES